MHNRHGGRVASRAEHDSKQGLHTEMHTSRLATYSPFSKKRLPATKSRLLSSASLCSSLALCDHAREIKRSQRVPLNSSMYRQADAHSVHRGPHLTDPGLQWLLVLLPIGVAFESLCRVAAKLLGDQVILVYAIFQTCVLLKLEPYFRGKIPGRLSDLHATQA